MIEKCKCKICGEEYKCNGVYQLDMWQWEHLRVNHNQEFKKIKATAREFNELRENKIKELQTFENDIVVGNMFR